MPYLTREDGERFVIPSYRDVMSAKNKNLLKKDILLLSQNYGSYITLQKKSATQYEVAFSPDAGYLLGETIWHYFKKPIDMIYCEAIPNTTEAILVIVKGNSVYLDGRFPIDTIPEELVIFLTQQNFFQIFVYGDVPIGQTPEGGKFSFEANSVKSFTVLDKPAFPELPLIKTYQLQLVDPVLKKHGIGVFPARKLITVIVIAILGYLAYSYISSRKEAMVQPILAQVTENPYKEFYKALSSPAPDQEIASFINTVKTLVAIPGWNVNKIDYTKGTLIADVKSYGGSVEDLTTWSQLYGAQIGLSNKGVTITMQVPLKNRQAPKDIYPLKQSLVRFIDKLSSVYPGNHIQVSEILKKGSYSETTFSISLDTVTPLVIGLIGQQLNNLPFDIQKITLNINKGLISGTIVIEALGN